MVYKGLEVPNFEMVEFKNIYSGSFFNKNYKIFPGENVRVVIWDGQNCFEKSELTAEKEFDYGKDGYDEMIEWIYQQCVVMHK